MTRTALLLFLFLSFQSSAKEVDSNLCHDVDSTTKSSVPSTFVGWLKFPHAVQLCPLYAFNRRLAWSIATIRLDILPGSELDDRTLHPPAADGLGFTGYPCPRIIDPNGHDIGRISEPFPTTSPGYTRIMASDWQGNFPRHIDVQVTGAAVDGDYKGLSLAWNAASHKYEHRGKWQSFCDG